MAITTTQKSPDVENSKILTYDWDHRVLPKTSWLKCYHSLTEHWCEIVTLSVLLPLIAHHEVIQKAILQLVGSLYIPTCSYAIITPSFLTLPTTLHTVIVHTQVIF